MMVLLLRLYVVVLPRPYWVALPRLYWVVSVDALYAFVVLSTKVGCQLPESDPMPYWATEPVPFVDALCVFVALSTKVGCQLPESEPMLSMEPVPYLGMGPLPKM